jgi:hypothetical protein
VKPDLRNKVAVLLEMFKVATRADSDRHTSETMLSLQVEHLEREVFGSPRTGSGMQTLLRRAIGLAFAIDQMEELPPKKQPRRASLLPFAHGRQRPVGR